MHKPGNVDMSKYKNMSSRDKTSRQIENLLSMNRATWKDTYRKGDSYKTDMSIKIIYMEDDDADIAEKIRAVRSAAESRRPIVKVFHEDIYALLNALHKENFRNPDPLLVNPGNNNNPIPGVKKGAEGEEMDLFRRSNYFLAVEESMYPIHEGEVIYSPTVVIFKNEHGKRIENPVSVGIVSVPPVVRPSLISVSNPSGSGYMESFENASDKERTQKRIYSMFKIAIDRGHDTIIVTNYGGGTYQNPLIEITAMFNEAIARYPIPYVFFAIKTQEKREKDKDFLAFHTHIKRNIIPHQYPEDA